MLSCIVCGSYFSEQDISLESDDTVCIDCDKDNLHPIYWREYPGAWLRFHADNPQVYEFLKRSAMQLKANGHKKWGMKSLIEVLRWQQAMQTTDTMFKINNNHAPYYARYLMDMEPELEGFFNIRKVKQ